MNTKRVFLWVIFVIVLALIVWGVIVSLNKGSGTPTVGTPAPVTLADHVERVGPLKPPVELIEYSDFQCPACEAYYPLIEHVLASTTVPITFVYRHFPLPQHPNAKPAAYASEAASIQGKFWEMYALLFANHTQWTELDDPTSIFEGYAERIGLNVPKFRADMASAGVHDGIDVAIDAAHSLGLFQTPTFFLNGKMLKNPQSYEQFNADIKAAAR